MRTLRTQALSGAAGLLLALATAQAALAQGGDGGGSNEGIGPGGSMCNYNGDCTGGALGNRTVNRRDMAIEPETRVFVPDRNVRRDSDRNYRRDEDRSRSRQDYYREPDVEVYIQPSYRSAPSYRYAPTYRSISRIEAHINWCYARYKSYRERDNSYKPTRGPRKQCYSPYS